MSPTQINVLTPADSSQGPVPIVVTNAAGTSSSVTATMQTVLPGLFVASNFVRAVRYPDGVIINGTGSAESGYKTAAAVGPGDTIALFGTGFGPTTPSVSSGAVFTGAYPTNNAVTVTIGGLPASVLWAGLVGLGLYQINVTIPSALTDGDQAVVAIVSGVGTGSTALLKVAASARLSALLRRWAGSDSLRSPEKSLVGVEWLRGLVGPASEAQNVAGSLIQLA